MRTDPTRSVKHITRSLPCEEVATRISRSSSSEWPGSSKILSVASPAAIARQGSRWFRTAAAYAPDRSRRALCRRGRWRRDRHPGGGPRTRGRLRVVPRGVAEREAVAREPLRPGCAGGPIRWRGPGGERGASREGGDRVHVRWRDRGPQGRESGCAGCRTDLRAGCRDGHAAGGEAAPEN